MIGVFCKTCAFWSPLRNQVVQNRRLGLCRARRPAIELIPGQRPRTVWPTVFEEDWCGDHATLTEE